MISAVPSVSSVHVELDGSLPSTAGTTDVTTKTENWVVSFQKVGQDHRTNSQK